MKPTARDRDTRLRGWVNRWDLLAMALVVLTALLLLLWPAMVRTGGSDTVEVSVDGQIAVLPLLEDGHHPFEGPDSPFVVSVQDRTVRMERAGCPDQLCVHQGALRGPSGTIVCLPNRTIIRIPGEPAYDGVSR